MRSIRWIVCSLLIVLAGLGAAGSVLALFVHTQVNDTDSYVETVAPLASEPAVQAAVVDRLTEELTQTKGKATVGGGHLGEPFGEDAPRTARLITVELADVQVQDNLHVLN